MPLAGFDLIAPASKATANTLRATCMAIRTTSGPAPLPVISLASRRIVVRSTPAIWASNNTGRT